MKRMTSCLRDNRSIFLQLFLAPKACPRQSCECLAQRPLFFHRTPEHQRFEITHADKQREKGYHIRSEIVGNSKNFVQRLLIFWRLTQCFKRGSIFRSLAPHGRSYFAEYSFPATHVAGG